MFDYKFSEVLLYCRLPFGQLDQRNQTIQEVAAKLGRTPSSLAMKLVNFASLDPSLMQKGLQGASKADRQIWKEFQENWEQLVAASEAKLSELLEPTTLPEDTDVTEIWITSKARLKQGFFRSTILANYNYCCCLTDNPIPEILVAGHILPWSSHPEHRLNPYNGLCLARTYERAFDMGLIALDEDYRLLVSIYVNKFLPNVAVERDFLAYQGKQINLPLKFKPDLSFLTIHRETIFQQV